MNSVSKIDGWLKHQPTSKRRITVSDVETGLMNRLQNSESVNNFIRDEAESRVAPYYCDYEKLQVAMNELQRFYDMGYTTREAKYYTEKAGTNNPILNEMCVVLAEIDQIQSDYDRWLRDVDQAACSIWKEIEPQIKAKVSQVARERCEHTA